MKLEKQKRKYSLIIIAFLFPFYLGLHFMYGMIVREPYPSFMMPGFSRVDNNLENYSLIDNEYIIKDKKGIEKKYDILDITSNFSKIALNRVVDLAFFNKQISKNYNSKQKQYYTIIKDFLGEELYKKHILAVRHPSMTSSEIETFGQWLIKSCKKNIGYEPVSIKIEKYKLVRNMKTGELINRNLIATKKITKK